MPRSSAAQTKVITAAQAVDELAQRLVKLDRPRAIAAIREHPEEDREDLVEAMARRVTVNVRAWLSYGGVTIPGVALP